MLRTHNGNFMYHARAYSLKALVTLVAVGLCSQAHADFFTSPVSLTVGPTTTDFSSTFTFNQFTPGVGQTLTGVEITLQGVVNGTIRIENTGGSPITATGLLRATVSLTRPGGGAITQVIPVGTQVRSLTAFDGNIDFGGTSGFTSAATGSQTSGPTIYTGALLTDFLGAGTVDLPVSATGTSTATGGGNIVSSFSTSATATATLRYTYTDSSPATPEPGTWAMLAAGASTGLVALRRRRRNKK